MATERMNEYAAGSDSSKRPRYELSCVETNASRNSASNNVIQSKEETGSSAVKEVKEIMLEKGPWSHPSSGTSAPQDEDSNRRTSCSTSDDNRSSNQCIRSRNMDSFSNELCAADPIMGDQAAVVDNNLFRYQLNNASNNDNNIGLFSNNLQGKESSDLLYYGWPEIETFEDVDRMFRSCDSTFGLEIDKDDELGWFSSAHAIEGSDDALKTSFIFSDCDRGAINSVSKHHEVYGLNNSGLLANENDSRRTPVSLKKVSQKLTPNSSPDMMDYSCSDGSGAISHIDNGSQIQSNVSQSKEQKPSEGKRKERPTDNGDSFIRMDDLKPLDESNHSLNIQCNFLVETQTELETRHDLCSQKPIPLQGSNDNQPSNLLSPRSSAIKSEDSGLPSASPRESSHESNQLQSAESPKDVSFKNPAVSGNKKKERSHQRRLSSQLEKRKSMAQRANADSVSAPKKVTDVENKVEGQSEVNGSNTGILGELDSSNQQESPCVSSVVDEVSIEASSFRQLQRVMEQLDIRTKLCIRDRKSVV